MYIHTDSMAYLNILRGVISILFFFFCDVLELNRINQDHEKGLAEGY